MGPVKYTMKLESYPRFKYFRKHLDSIAPRVQAMTGDDCILATCVSQGKETLQRITESAKYLQEEIVVVVAGNDIKIPPGFPAEIQVLKGEIIQETVAISNIMEILKQSTKYHPHFLVCLVTSISPQTVRDLFNQFSDLENQQQQNIIVYDVVAKVNYSFQELFEARYDKQSIKLVARNHNVGLQIQYLLEDRVIEVLEDIVEFNKRFVPKPGVATLKGIMDECSDKITTSLRSQYVMDDLDPEKVPTEDADDPDAMDTGDPDTQATKILSESEKDELFYKLLLKFIAKKSKCIICDHLAEQFGISSSLINEFLNERFFDYNNKYEAHVKDVQKPKWVLMKKGGHYVSTLNYSFIFRQHEFFAEVENYIKQLLKVLVIFDKLNFEVFGLLRKTKVPVFTCLPEYPELPLKMQKELLRFPSVMGCGTIYGTLTIHVKDEKDIFLDSEIQKVLERYAYRYGYRVQTLLKREHHANFENIECGKALRAELTQEAFERLQRERARHGEQINREMIGTLGCFIGLRKKMSVEAMECEGAESVLYQRKKTSVEAMQYEGTESGDHNKAALYCITCAHCVRGCNPRVQVRLGHRNPKFEDLGERELICDEGEQVDIAAVRVKDDKVSECEVHIDLMKWEFSNKSAGDLVASHVTKFGAMTDRTEGMIISNDYRSEVHDHTRESVMRECNEKGFNFDDSYNVLVEVIPGLQPFLPNSLFAANSEEGDMEDEQEQGVDSDANKLWLGDLDDGETEESIRGLSLGNVQIELEPDHKVAFLEYSTEDQAVNNYKRFKGLGKTVKFRGRKERNVDSRRLVVKEEPPTRYGGNNLTEHHLKSLSTDILDVIVKERRDQTKYALLEFRSRAVAKARYQDLKDTKGLGFELLKTRKNFSESGDSGAVIFISDLKLMGETAIAVSLLEGSMKLDDTLEGNIEWTYSSHLKKSLDLMCGDDYEIVMPWNI